MTPDQQPRLFELISGYMVTQAVGIAVRLELPELVSERPRSAGELAAAADADPDSIRRLLRMLASFGIFDEEDGVIVPTELSDGLRRDVPGSLANTSLMFSGYHYDTWGGALESFQTGQPAFAKVHGKPAFDWLAEHPAEAALFNSTMADRVVERRQLLVDRDWTGVSTIVDVGGGTGATLVPLLQRHASMTAIVFDLPHVGPDAARTIEGAKLAARCAFAAGSFFESVPPGADVYVLSRILHDWGDEPASAILRSVRRAVRPDSRLLLLESVLAPGNQRDNAKILDLHMLVVHGGKERDEDEWQHLLSGEGFAITQIESGLVEAVPV